MFDGTFNGLCFIAVMLSAWLIATGINDAIELNEQKTTERRERYRGRAFAEMDRKRMLKQNRNALWQEVERL